MKNDEVINRIKSGNYSNGNGFDLQTLINVVGTLSEMIRNGYTISLPQQPCEDAVSKQAVVSALEGEYSDWNDDYNVPITHCIKAVQSIPPVQPVPVARVMTFEEIEAIAEPAPVYLEEKDEDGWVIIRCIRRVYNEDEDTSFAVFGTYLDNIDEIEPYELNLFSYGETWRCWTYRPTDEQREAVKWG